MFSSYKFRVVCKNAWNTKLAHYTLLSTNSLYFLLCYAVYTLAITLLLHGFLPTTLNVKHTILSGMFWHPYQYFKCAIPQPLLFFRSRLRTARYYLYTDSYLDHTHDIWLSKQPTNIPTHAFPIEVLPLSGTSLCCLPWSRSRYNVVLWSAVVLLDSWLLCMADRSPCDVLK